MNNLSYRDHSRRLLALVLMALPQFSVAADEQPVFPTEDDFLAEIPVVLSVTRLAQPRSDAPASITVIDRDMIAASGIKEIPMLLRLVPGFQAGHDSASSLAPRQTPVSYMGYSDAFSRKMQVLIDGRSVYDPMFGGVRWSELGLALEDIERIEVIRGPNAASYGSNSFLGVINIITRDPTLESGTTLLEDGASDGDRQATVRHSHSGGKFSYRLTASRNEDQGFVGLHDKNDTSALAWRSESRLTDRDSLTFNMGVTQGMRQMGDGTASTEINPYHDAFINNNYQQLKWNRRESADREFTLQIYHNYAQLDNSYTSYPGGTLATRNNSDTRTHRWDLEFQRTLRTSDTSRLVWGGEIRRDEAWGPAWYTSNDWKQLQLYRVFANSEWSPSPKWTSNAGLMIESSSASGVAYSPRLALNYHVNTNNTVRGSISRAYRNPSIFEQYAFTTLKVGDLGTPPGTTYLYFYGNGMVRPEVIDAVEFAYIHENPARNLFFDAKTFFMRIGDVLSYPGGGPAVGSLTPVYTYANGGVSSIYGVEFQLKSRLGNKTTASVNYAYAWHDGWYISNLTGPVTGDSDGSTPNHTFSFLLDHKFNTRWRAGLFYYYVSELGWFGGTSSDYHVANLRLAHRFGPGSRSPELELIGQNLAGKYFDFRDYAVSDRRYYLGLKIPI